MSDAEPAKGSAIQPVGFLVTLSGDWRVSRASANIGDYLGGTASEMIGRSVTSLFSPSAIHSLRNRLALLRGPNAAERLFSIPLTDDSTHYDVAVHMSGEEVVIEAEPNDVHHHDRESTGTVRGMIAQLGEVDGFAPFLDAAARQLRALTGFDRVTIHRCLPNSSTEQVGEAMRNGAAAAMPAEAPPIPFPDGARAASPHSQPLFVADVDAAPVPILPQLDRRGRTTDLSRAMLRAVPEAEIEQLRGSGVLAALSLPIIVDGRPWGLVACHHHAPCRPSFERRSAAEYYAIMLAMQIEIRELKAELGRA